MNITRIIQCSSISMKEKFAAGATRGHSLKKESRWHFNVIKGFKQLNLQWKGFYLMFDSKLRYILFNDWIVFYNKSCT